MEAEIARERKGRWQMERERERYIYKIDATRKPRLRGAAISRIKRDGMADCSASGTHASILARHAFFRSLWKTPFSRRGGFRRRVYTRFV